MSRTAAAEAAAGLPGGFGRSPIRIPIGRSAGGGGLSGIIILVVLFFALKACGIDPLQILAGGDGGECPGRRRTGDARARRPPPTR